jgi:hypothetical protein
MQRNGCQDDSLTQLMLDVAAMQDSLQRIKSERQKKSPGSVTAAFSPTASVESLSQVAMRGESFFSPPELKRSISPKPPARSGHDERPNPCAVAQDLTNVLAAVRATPPSSPVRAKNSPAGSPKKVQGEYGFNPYSGVGFGR